MIAMESLPAWRAGATAVDWITFGSVETRAAITAVGAPFILGTG